MKRRLVRIGAILLGLGFLSGLAEEIIYRGRVDENGVLQESFLLPLTFLLVMPGLLLLLVAAGLALRDIVREQVAFRRRA